MKEKIIEKIQKMLTLAANDPESEESKTAARMAGELMAKYQIEQFDLKGEEEEKITFDEFGTTIKSDEMWHGQLAIVLSEVFDCYVLKVRVGEKEYVWRFFGMKSDVTLMSWYFKFLRIKIGKMGSDRYKKAREKRDYCLGVVVGLKEVLDTMFASRKESMDETTTDLVIAKRENVERQVREKHPKIRTQKSAAKHNFGLIGKGTEDGKNISLHRPVSGKSKAEKGLVIS